MIYSHTDLAALQMALRSGFFSVVPDDNVGLAIPALATAVDMDVNRTRSVLKMLATHRIFEEHKGELRHTSTSALLRCPDFAALTEASLGEFAKASLEMPEWNQRSPHTQGLTDNAFSQRFGNTFYGHCARFPKDAHRFSQAMRAWGTSPSRQ